MNTQKLFNCALTGIDRLGFRLDSMGITSKVNRHNLAAYLMLEQKYLEGQWDSLQVRIDRRKLQLENRVNSLEGHTGAIVSPLVERVARLRLSSSQT